MSESIDLGHPPATPPREAASGESCDPVIAIVADPAALESEWTAFEREACATPFQSFFWLSRWQRTIGRKRGIAPAIITGRDGAGALLFIFPLAITRSGPVRRLTWLGSELCDYNAPLLARGFGEGLTGERFLGLWRAILACLRGDSRLDFDVVDLAKMPEGVDGVANPFLALSTNPHPSGAYAVTLGRDWDEFYCERRSSATRKKERRQLKGMAQFGALRLAEATPGDGVHAIDILMAQKGRVFARLGIDNMFDRAGHREFYRAVAAAAGTNGIPHLTRYEIGAATGAVQLALRFHGRYYLVLSSYAEAEFTRFGPGRAHMNELLRYAIDNGFQVFDFTVGDEPYKSDWTDRDLVLRDHLAAVSLKGRLYVWAIAASRRAKRLIKRTPALWHAFTEARAGLGRLRRRRR
jgi:CelD/BcsL family acetyltransferase involved in cellulose biosynthesis